MKLTVDANIKYEGIVYVLEIEVDGKRVVKVGLTTKKIEERVVQILTSHFKAYRHFPYCRPKRFRKTDNIYEKEQKILRYFEDKRYKSELKFDGCTELLDVPLEAVVEIYEKVTRDQEIGEKYEEENSRDEIYVGDAGEDRREVRSSGGGG